MTGKCTVCGKTAYVTEQVKNGTDIYHKACFRCSVCKGSLTLKNFKTQNKILFCNTHYQLPKSAADQSTGAEPQASGYAEPQQQYDQQYEQPADQGYSEEQQYQ